MKSTMHKGPYQEYEIYPEADLFVNDVDENGDPDTLSFSEIIDDLKTNILEMAETGALQILAEKHGKDAADALIVFRVQLMAFEELHRRYHGHIGFREEIIEASGIEG